MSGTASIPDLDERLARLARDWSQDPDLAAAYLFGSHARGQPHRASDVDIAVVLRADLSASARWRKRLELIDSAASILSRDDVDLVILEEVPSALGHRVLRDGRLVVDRDPHRRVQVVQNVLTRYLDEAPLREALDEGLRSRLREGRFAR
jgi:predicted nucleotidyltransferase